MRMNGAVAEPVLSHSGTPARTDGEHPQEAGRYVFSLTTARPTVSSLVTGAEAQKDVGGSAQSHDALAQSQFRGSVCGVIHSAVPSASSTGRGGSRSWTRPQTYTPTPISCFSVAVSIIPAEQLAQPLGASAGGLLGRSSTYAGFASSPSTTMPPPMLTNGSFANNVSFANTKSFDDVLLLRHAATATAAAGAGGSGSGNGLNNSVGGHMSWGSASEDVQGALAGTGGGAGTESVPNSADCYRVHLLLDSGSAAIGSTPSLSEGALVEAGSSVTGSGEGKKQQVSQVKTKWRQFLQLLQFVDSVAPKFDPPSPPSGLPFPIERGKSYVKNSSFLTGPGALVHQDGGGAFSSPVMGGNLPSEYGLTAGGGGGLVANSSFGHGPDITEAATKEEAMVTPSRREARRRFMEDYLNAAIAAPGVNCLDELHNFVGYQLFLRNERTQFAASAAAAKGPKSNPSARAGRTSTSGPSLLTATTSGKEAPAAATAGSDEKGERKGKRGGKRSSSARGYSDTPAPAPAFGSSLHSLNNSNSGVSDLNAAAAPTPRDHTAAAEDVPARRVLRRLSPDALADVYAYYQRTSIAHRDPHEVARMVADREKWPVLPLVEDIVVLDRYLEGSC